MFPEAIGYDNNYTSYTTEKAFPNILANARTIQQVGTYHITTAKRIWINFPLSLYKRRIHKNSSIACKAPQSFKAKSPCVFHLLQLEIFRMNAKIQVFLFAVVLFVSMVNLSESFAGGGNMVGKKRSSIEQVVTLS